MSEREKIVEIMARGAHGVFNNSADFKSWGQLNEREISEYQICLSGALSALEDAGYVIVPKEPGWAMQIAGRDAMLSEDDELDLSTDDARACYLAMLVAKEP